MTGRGRLARLVGVGVASVVVLAGCATQSPSSQEQQLARTLNSNLQAAGLPGIPESTAVALYGVDGGVSCENAGQLQNVLGLSQFGNVSGNPRRIILDPSVIAYDRAVIETYCPDRLAEFDDIAGSLSTGQTIPQS